MKITSTLLTQIVTLGLFLFNCQNLKAQCTCDFDEVIDLPRNEITNKFIPDDFTSMKYVKMNFHFMMKSDSTLNFTPFDDGNGNCEFTAYDYSEILINYANSMLSQNGSMNLPPNNSTLVLNRKYRLKLEGIYFHYDDNAYAFYEYPEILDPTEITHYSVNANTEINVFFVYKDDERLSDDEKGILGGDKLTLKDCILHVPAGANIIVKQGGRLVVDGATITNRCGLMWSGIEVWGNSAAHQYPDASGHYAQGYVELKNGAVIENAECALTLWHPNHYNTTGGIVHAENATFRADRNIAGVYGYAVRCGEYVQNGKIVVTK